MGLRIAQVMALAAFLLSLYALLTALALDDFPEIRDRARLVELEDRIDGLSRLVDDLMLRQSTQLTEREILEQFMDRARRRKVVEKPAP